MLTKLPDCYKSHIRIWKIWTENVNKTSAIIITWYQISKQSSEISDTCMVYVHMKQYNEAFRDVKQNDINGKSNNLNYHESHWHTIYNVWCNYHMTPSSAHSINVAKGFSAKAFMYAIQNNSNVTWDLHYKWDDYLQNDKNRSPQVPFVISGSVE